MRKFLLSVALLFFSSCSTLESLKSSNNQNILIETPHVEGAECNLSDKTGRKWRIFDTPSTVAIQEGHPPLVIICTKKGFKTSVLTINEHKEELLTIDGKHIDVSIYGDFPTKFPRLIPAAIKETAGFVQDPTGSISTTYPNKIIVWMEPKKWESEEQMREWAFDREVEDRAEFISEQDAKLTDEQRKEKRRAEKKKRDEDFKKLKKRLQDAGKRGARNTMKMFNPSPAVEGLVKSGRNVVDHNEALQNIHKDSNNKNLLIDEETGQIGIFKDSPDRKTTIDVLNKRNATKEKNRALREQKKNENGNPDASDLNGDSGNYELLNKYDLDNPQDTYGDYNKGEIKYDENGMRVK